MKSATNIIHFLVCCRILFISLCVAWDEKGWKLLLYTIIKWYSEKIYIMKKTSQWNVCIAYYRLSKKAVWVYTHGSAHSHVHLTRGYALRNLSFDDLLVVLQTSYSARTRAWWHSLPPTWAARCSLLLLGSKPKQHVTVWNTRLNQARDTVNMRHDRRLLPE